MVQNLHRGDNISGHWLTISIVDCKDASVNWYGNSFDELDVDGEFQKCTIFKCDGKFLKLNRIPIRGQKVAEDLRRTPIRMKWPFGGQFDIASALDRWQSIQLVYFARRNFVLTFCLLYCTQSSFWKRGRLCKERICSRCEHIHFSYSRPLYRKGKIWHNFLPLKA